MNRTQAILLGTGTPNPDPLRMGPCTAITVGDRAYLVDCGAGLVRRAHEAFTQGIAALDVKNLDRLFLTHLHSDHTVGLPDLIFSPWVMGRALPLQVHGPKGTGHLVDQVVSAYGALDRAIAAATRPGLLFGRLWLGLEFRLRLRRHFNRNRLSNRLIQDLRIGNNQIGVLSGRRGRLRACGSLSGLLDGQCCSWSLFTVLGLTPPNIATAHQEQNPQESPAKRQTP